MIWFPWRRKWKLLRAQPYRDVSFGFPGVPATRLYFLTDKGKPVEKVVSGTWKKEDFKCILGEE